MSRSGVGVGIAMGVFPGTTTNSISGGFDSCKSSTEVLQFIKNSANPRTQKATKRLDTFKIVIAVL